MKLTEAVVVVADVDVLVLLVVVEVLVDVVVVATGMPLKFALTASTIAPVMGVIVVPPSLRESVVKSITSAALGAIEMLSVSLFTYANRSVKLTFRSLLIMLYGSPPVAKSAWLKVTVRLVTLTAAV